MKIVLSRKPAAKIGRRRNPYPETIVTHQEHSSVSLLGDVAQLGEHLPCTQGVIGSIPFISTNLNCSDNSVVRVPPCLGGSRGFDLPSERQIRSPS